ncbi:hypothetical protein [Roseateles sp. DXS20W]
MTRLTSKGLKAIAAAVNPPLAAMPERPQAGNVVMLRATEQPESAPRRPVSAALQDDPMFKDLCDADYEALGFRDGTRVPDHEGLDQGCARIRARARLVFDHMVQARIAWLDESELQQLAVGQQGSALGCERMRAQSNAWRRDIETIKQQRELAGEHQGWIEPLVVDYRAGFQRALRGAINAQWLR